MTDLKQAITNWDGKSSVDIQNIYYEYNQISGFASTLVDFCQSNDLQKGATWLIKYFYDQGLRLKAGELRRVFDGLTQLKYWESKLHILQCLPQMPVARAQTKQVEYFVRNCLMDKNKFVRAWAYNGFYELSLQYPEFSAEAQQILDIAMKDEAPSVKARIRNILKNN